MPVLKRTYQVGYSGPAKRMKMAKLQRRVILNKPEVKDIVLSYGLPAALAPNTIATNNIFNRIEPGTGQGNRIGNKIRVLSIEIAGRPFGLENNGDFYLIRPNDASDAPSLPDFGTTIGALYDLTQGWPIYHVTRDGANLSVVQPKRINFPMGMVVTYAPPNIDNPSGYVNKNAVYAASLNRTGQNLIGVSYSIRVRFTDA